MEFLIIDLFNGFRILLSIDLLAVHYVATLLLRYFADHYFAMS